MFVPRAAQAGVSRLMSAREADLQSIYLAMVANAGARLSAANVFLARHREDGSVPELEASILQVRKALEAIAFAAIAPNKSAYEAFRAQATEKVDYPKDYHAGKIFHILGKINPNFYPLALLPATRQPDGTWHFDRKTSGYLTKNRFESFYDRLGRHLHESNPWGSNNNLQNLAGDIPALIDEARSLLQLHAAFIQTPEFQGAWVVEVAADGSAPRIVVGQTTGAFVVATR